MNTIVRLENYEQLVEEFPYYDTVAIIYKTLEFLRKLENDFKIYANYEKYIDRTPLREDLENDIHFLLCKRKELNEQKEFRISLPEIKITELKFIK